MPSVSCGRHTALAFLVVLVLAQLLGSDSMVSADSSYRKPPFNGSIFGKRSSSNLNNNNGENTSMTIAEIVRNVILIRWIEQTSNHTRPF